MNLDDKPLKFPTGFLHIGDVKIPITNAVLRTEKPWWEAALGREKPVGGDGAYADTDDEKSPRPEDRN